MIPIDLKRCQAEKPNGQNAMTLGGGHKMIRCVNEPNFIATEKSKAGADGLCGSMTLCNDCLDVAKEQLPKDFFNLIPIKNESKPNI